MKILFENNESVELILSDNDTAERFKKMYKHLQHVQLDFKPWDNCYYKTNTPYETHVDNLIKYAKKLSLELDREKCLARDQAYFNNLHKIYEKNYDGNPQWLDFHEHIHICETTDCVEGKYKRIVIDYREKAGPLTKKIDKSILDKAQVYISQGQLYTCWSELGKTAYTYFQDNEPDDINRMCELIKPWIHLRPKIYISLSDYNFLDDKNVEDFEKWWSKYSTEWCKYYNLESYDIYDVFGVLPFGQVDNFNKFHELLLNNILPKKVTL